MVFVRDGSNTSCTDSMNRQKFYFELLPDNSIKITCGKGLYTKLDLGIVKYHFEVVSGKVNWR